MMEETRVTMCEHYIQKIETIKEYINCLYAIKGCGTGGLLHILIDDDNIDDDSIMFCMKECIKNPDEEESKLGRVICEEFLSLSMEQRRLLTTTGSYLCYCNGGHCETCFIKIGDLTERKVE